jgi:DeoR/GlpR family transcriptional regulator of sugar metabolism
MGRKVALDERQKAEIRVRAAFEKASTSQLAVDYGVSRPTIRKALREGTALRRLGVHLKCSA